MPLPLVYNIRSVRERWTSSLVAIVGIAGAVGVFVAMLALARGFQATLVSSGQPDNVIVEQAGADTEMTSALDLEAVHAIENAPYIKRQGRDALISPEVVVVANLQLRGPQGGDANVEVRGVATRVLSVRDNVHVVQGRFFTPGLYELSSGNTRRSLTRVSSWAALSASGRDRGRSSGSSTLAGAPSTPRSGPTRTCSTRTTSGRTTSSSRSR